MFIELVFISTGCDYRLLTSEQPLTNVGEGEAPTAMLSQFGDHIATAPLIFDTLFHSAPVDLPQYQSACASSPATLSDQLAKLRQQIIEFRLVEKLLALISRTDRLDAFIAGRGDVNYLIFFLANLCSLIKLDVSCLRTVKTVENLLVSEYKLFERKMKTDLKE